MPNLNDIWLFRIISIDNLTADLARGLFSKLNAPNDGARIVIGNTEIITQRDKREVLCFPGTVVNNFVPFYFSVRTPMLYNIHSGHGVPQIHQKNIVYLCIPLLDLANPDFNWCFTDGNAAKRITRYYTSLAEIDSLDWPSIKTTDFSHDNADGDEDRIRKKHAEFLVRNHVPSNKIKGIAVYNQEARDRVLQIMQAQNLKIEIKIKKGFYF
ncbi:DUF4433 domain-containing protein [Aequorivita viscosa]|nr:DUF4433 domain-containing protein [Aequorivita viscosa]